MDSSAERSDVLHSKDYLTEFCTDNYLQGYTYFEAIPWFVKHLKELVGAFVHNSARLGHERALEFGAGPTLVSSYILAQYVQSITFSEYAPSNLKAVEDWINQGPTAHSWTNVFGAIAEEYRQRSGKIISLPESEEHLRKALQRGGLLRIDDVNESGHCPVLDDQANYAQYDIVASSFCLECACLTYDAYEATIGRLYTLLKPGGFLLLVHSRNQTFYCVNGKRFHALTLKELYVRENLEKVGLIDIQLRDVERTPDTYSDANGYIIACGYKMK